MLATLDLAPVTIQAPPAALADRALPPAEWLDAAHDAYGAYLDSLTPRELDHLEWYGDICGDTQGIDARPFPVTIGTRRFSVLRLPICTCRN